MAINHQDDDMVINFAYQQDTMGGVVYKLQYYKKNNDPTIVVQKDQEEAYEIPAEMFLEVADFLREKVYGQKTAAVEPDSPAMSPGIPLPVIDDGKETSTEEDTPFESFVGGTTTPSKTGGLQLPDVEGEPEGEAVPEAPLVSEEDIEALLTERAEATAKAKEKKVNRK